MSETIDSRANIARPYVPIRCRQPALASRSPMTTLQQSEPPEAVPAGQALGRRLRELRRSRRRTLRTVAEAAEVSESFLSQIERGRANPSVSSLTRIAAALGDKKFCILRNHGSLTVGGSVEEAVGCPVGYAMAIPAALPGTDAAIIEDRSTPAAAAPSFDSKAFQGRFVSGKTALDITADGVFALDTDGAIVNGTWSLQAGGKKATLDPDSKGEADRELDILSNDSVKIVGGATLKRQNGAN